MMFSNRASNSGRTKRWSLYPQIRIKGKHLHHGRTGEILMAIGLLLIIHDWADRPFRFSV
jgi:hypothetical protein